MTNNFTSSEIPLNLKLNLSNPITPDFEFVYIIRFTTLDSFWLNISGFVYILRSNTAEEGLTLSRHPWAGSSAPGWDPGGSNPPWVRSRSMPTGTWSARWRRRGPAGWWGVRRSWESCRCRYQRRTPPPTIPADTLSLVSLLRARTHHVYIAHCTLHELHARESEVMFTSGAATTSRLAVHRPTGDWLLRRERWRGETECE